MNCNIKIRPYIVDNSELPNYFQFFNNICCSLMLFPFIFISPRSKIKKNSQFTYDQILNHEKIHFVQCLETFIIGFYIIYLFEIICNYMKYGNLWDAYINVRFEKEAYTNMSNLDYCKNRDLYAWRINKLFPDETYNIEEYIIIENVDEVLNDNSEEISNEETSNKETINEETSKDMNNENDDENENNENNEDEDNNENENNENNEDENNEDENNEDENNLVSNIPKVTFDESTILKTKQLRKRN